jgi:hypothetical protein
MIGTAMEVGGFDLLCVLPRHELLELGIPFIRMMIEHEIALWELEGMDIFWGNYFAKQWIPIASAWNVRKEDGTIFFYIFFLLLNSLTAKSVPAGTKYSRPVGFYSRNSTKSTVNPNITIPQT